MLSNVMDEDRVMELAGDISRELTPSCYSSSKHALARWVRRISPSWAVDGLRINAVAPGNTTTPMTQGMTDTQEITNGIVFLASLLASRINGIITMV